MRRDVIQFCITTAASVVLAYIAYRIITSN